MRNLIRMIAALLAVMVLGVMNSTGASAATAYAGCDTPIGVVNDQQHSYTYHYFTDSGGYTRVTWDSWTINNATTAGSGTEYYVHMDSIAGTHYSTGVVRTGVRYLNVSVPTSANARLVWNPALIIESGASDDGYARCMTKLQF